MKNNTLRALLATTILSGAATMDSEAVTYNYHLGADNDFALYTANDTGFGISGMTLQVDNTTYWTTTNSGSFTSDANYIYIWGHNFSGPGNVAGKINGIDITTVTWERTADIRSKVTGIIASESFTPDISNITILSATETFTGPAPLYLSTSGISSSLGVSSGLNLPGTHTSYIFRTEASNLVPEPSSTMLLGLGSAGFLIRRKRNA